MTASTTTSLTGDIWHLSIDNLLAPLPQTLRLGGTGPFVINLSASIAPFELPVKGVAGCPQAHVYQVQHTEDGRRRYRLRLGPFGSEDEVDKALKIVREVYPSALTATASAADLRAIAILQPKVAVSAVSAILPTEHIPVTAFQTQRESVSTVAVELVPDTCGIDLVKAAVVASESAAEPAANLSAVRDVKTIQDDSSTPTPAFAQPDNELELAEIEYDLVAVAPATNENIARQTTSSAAARQNLSPAAPAQYENELSFVEFEYDLTPVSKPVANELVVQTAGQPAAESTVLELEADKASVSKSVSDVPSAVPAVACDETQEESVQVVRARLAKQLALLECEEDTPPVSRTVKSKSVVYPKSLDSNDQKSPRAARAQLAKELALVGRNANQVPASKPAIDAPIVPTAKSLDREQQDSPLQATIQPANELTQLELKDEDASAGFVVQLSLAPEAFDPDTVPTLDIFNVYRLYSIAGIDQGRIMHALRLGFFSDEISAGAVASYLGAFYDEPVIKRVGATERQRFATTPLAPRKDIGATGKQAKIEITGERFIRERRSG